MLESQYDSALLRLSQLVRYMTGDDLKGLIDIYILVDRLGLDLVYKGPV
jgi:hypothetical protein